MATTSCRRRRRSSRFTSVAKPSGALHPRVQKAQPEHFGIVAIDCAKARFKWMLADFYGRILVPPTLAEQTRHPAADFLGIGFAGQPCGRQTTAREHRDAVADIE